MPIDLDRLIRDADPARQVLISQPDPAAARSSFTRRPRRRTPLRGAFGTGIALAVTIAVVVIVVASGSDRTPSLSSGQSALTPGAVLAQSADPRDGLLWGMRSLGTNAGRTCIQVGRLRSGTLGVIGQDDSFGNDSRFHPLPPRARRGENCATLDAHGHPFFNVFIRQVAASAGLDAGTGECRVGPTPRQYRPCPANDLRNLSYGFLGPEALSITYVSATGHELTKPTGPDGAYLIVLPGTTESCVLQPGNGRSCVGGPGVLTTSALQSGAITAVTYRDGHVCRLPAPTPRGVPQGACPPVGYVAPRSNTTTTPHVNAARVASPVSASVFQGQSVCYRGGSVIPCDHGVPPGYRQGELGQQVLVRIKFTARIAADNTHSVYEWSIAGPRNPDCNGGTDATTMTPVRAGQHVVLADFERSTCHGRYTGLVTYQPNGYPGHDTLDAQSSIRDGSTLVGRFSFVGP